MKECRLDFLEISSHSVENYVSFIYDKASVHNRHEVSEKSPNTKKIIQNIIFLSVKVKSTSIQAGGLY